MKELKTPISILLYSVSLYICHIVLMDLARYVSGWPSTTWGSLLPKSLTIKDLRRRSPASAVLSRWPWGTYAISIHKRTARTQTHRPNTKNFLCLTQPNAGELCRNKSWIMQNKSAKKIWLWGISGLLYIYSKLNKKEKKLWQNKN